MMDSLAYIPRFIPINGTFLPFHTLATAVLALATLAESGCFAEDAGSPGTKGYFRRFKASILVLAVYLACGLWLEGGYRAEVVKALPAIAPEQLEVFAKFFLYHPPTVFAVVLSASLSAGILRPRGEGIVLVPIALAIATAAVPLVFTLVNRSFFEFELLHRQSLRINGEVFDRYYLATPVALVALAGGWLVAKRKPTVIV